MPLTEKRKKHLDRQNQKNKLLRTKSERLIKIDEIFDNFSRTGYPPTKEIKQFFILCKKWVDDGITKEGIIQVPSLKIEICYTLHNSKKYEVGAMIKYVGDTLNNKPAIPVIDTNNPQST